MDRSVNNAAKSAPLRYGVAVAAVAIAFAIRYFIPAPLGTTFPYFAFFPAVLLSALFGGLGPGLLASALAALAAVYFFIPPLYTLHIQNQADELGLIRFVVASVLVTLFSEALLSIRRRAKEVESLAAVRIREFQQQQQRASVVLASIGDAVIATDLDARVTFMNAVAERLTGWPASEATGEKIESVFPIFNEQTGTPVENPVERVLRDGTVTGLANHTLLEARGGARIPIDDSGAPVRDEDGRILGAVLVFRDITARRKAERERNAAQEELSRSQQQLSSILSSISDGFVALDRDWRYTYANPEAARQGRMSPAEMLGKSIWELFPMTVGTHFQHELERAMKGREPVLFEVDRPEDNQSFRLRVYPTPDGISIYGVDITAEKQRAALTARLAAIVESSDDAIVSKDLKGIVKTWNKGAERIFGYTEAEMVGQPIAKIAATDRINEMPQILDRIRRGERVDHYETVRRAKDGRLVDVSLTVSPIHASDGQIVGASKIARDITEQKAAARALVESEARLHIALEAGSMGAWEWHVQADKMIWSPQLEAIHGLEVGEFRGTFEAFEHTIHAEDRDRVLHAFRSAAEHRNDLTVEYRIPLPNGTAAWLETRGRFLSGDPPHMAGVCQDITERKRAEEELVSQAERVSRSNAELREFAYIASHDLQEPLRNISTFTQLLSQRYQGKFDEEADRFMSYVVDSAGRMTRLIRDLLSYSQVLHGDGDESAELPLNEPVEWALRNLHASVEENGAVVQIDPLPVVWGDKMQIAQLFQNLISNAIKYRSAEPPRIHISAEEDGSQVTVSVRDNGIGIAPTYHDKIFGIFRRLHGNDYPGTGIGLAICKKIVERHGGRIWVESEAGQGSAFKFSLTAKSRAARGEA